MMYATPAHSTTCNALWQLACLFLLRDAFLPLPPSHHGDGEGATATSAATETAAAEVFDPIFDAVRASFRRGPKKRSEQTDTGTRKSSTHLHTYTIKTNHTTHTHIYIYRSTAGS